MVALRSEKSLPDFPSPMWTGHTQQKLEGRKWREQSKTYVLFLRGTGMAPSCGPFYSPRLRVHHVPTVCQTQHKALSHTWNHFILLTTLGGEPCFLCLMQEEYQAQGSPGNQFQLPTWQEVGVGIESKPLPLNHVLSPYSFFILLPLFFSLLVRRKSSGNSVFSVPNKP